MVFRLYWCMRATLAQPAECAAFNGNVASSTLARGHGNIFAFSIKKCRGDPKRNAGCAGSSTMKRFRTEKPRNGTVANGSTKRPNRPRRIYPTTSPNSARASVEVASGANGMQARGRRVVIFMHNLLMTRWLNIFRKRSSGCDVFNIRKHIL